MADNTRSLTIKSTGPDPSALFNSKYNLQVAKSVITNNQRTSSSPLARSEQE